MKNVFASAVLVASMAVVGCSKSDDASPQVQKAADKTAGEASDAMGKVKSGVADATDKAKDMAKDQSNAAMANADAMQKQIDDLISKAKTAINDKRWDDAQGYLTQIKDMKSKLPEPVQTKIDSSIADVQKLIDAGKMMTPAK